MMGILQNRKTTKMFFFYIQLDGIEHFKLTQSVDVITLLCLGGLDTQNSLEFGGWTIQSWKPFCEVASILTWKS